MDTAIARHLQLPMPARRGAKLDEAYAREEKADIAKY